MTVGQLRKAIDDPALNDESEVMVSIKESLHNCECACCSDDIEIGVIDAAMSDVGKRVLLIVPEVPLWCTPPNDGIEEGDE